MNINIVREEVEEMRLDVELRFDNINKKLDDIYKDIEYIKNSDKSKEDDHDAYHTMEELYEHRTVLFALVCSRFPDMAWKSEKHSDGTSEQGWFIAGLETPYGQITYHQKSFYWNLFDCKILDKAPEYDGHTPGHVLTRLSQLINYKI